MIIQKWNYQTHAYDPYETDPAWKTVLYTREMDQKINCSSCGKDMTYGDGYTSQEIHNEIGLGYPVCEKCYEKESERRSQDKKS